MFGRPKIISLTIFLVNLIILTEIAGNDIDPCSKYQKCSKCLFNNDVQCSWCLDNNIKNRCYAVNSQSPSINCQSSESPKEPTSSPSEEKFENSYISLDPKQHEVEVNKYKDIQVSSITNIKMNLPIEIYILIDASSTMQTYIDLVKSEISKLLEMDIDNRKVKVGAGLIYDKKQVPSQSKSDSEFINIASLTEVEIDLESALDGIKIIPNLDSEESIFTGMLQAGLCDEQIGWSDKGHSLKFIVVATDADSHVAGDGLALGLNKQHENECMLNGEGAYSQNTDFPEMWMVEDMLLTKTYNTIFLVTESVKPIYDGVKRVLKKLPVEISILDDVNNSIVTLVEVMVRKIINNSVLNQEIEDSYLRLSVTNTCSGLSNNSCAILAGNMITSVTSINMKKCFGDQNYHMYKIPFGGFVTLSFNIKDSCQCPCSDDSNIKKGADICNGHGYQECEKCYCEDKYIGDSCECLDDSSQCIDSEDIYSQLCNGNGSCICGSCNCNQLENNPDKKYSGRYCQCSETNCREDHDGLLCGGSNRGKCECDDCVCLEGYGGISCSEVDCNSNVILDKCLSSDNNKICSDHGKCNCGLCICYVGFTGDTCESELVIENLCAETASCVTCELYGIGYNDKNTCATCNSSYTTTTQTPIEGKKYMCTLGYNDCNIYYDYYKNNKSIQIKEIETKKDCKSPFAAAIGVGATFASVILAVIGIVVVFFIARYYYDKKEYEKLMNERNNIEFNEMENPLFEPIANRNEMMEE